MIDPFNAKGFCEAAAAKAVPESVELPEQHRAVAPVFQLSRNKALVIPFVERPEEWKGGRQYILIKEKTELCMDLLFLKPWSEKV